MIKFGPSGACERFYAEGYKHTEQMADWVKKNGLDCYEYSFGRGVNVGEEKASSIKAAFVNAGVAISVHAPYFINMGTPDETKAINSFNYILSSVVAGRAMGAERVVIHPAAQGKEPRDQVVKRTLERFKALKYIIEEQGLDNYYYCIETMGKLAQIGTIEEVTEFCKLSENYYPCVDFGHVNAREQGSLKTKEDYLSRLNYMINELGYEKVRDMHVHFSKIEYSEKGEIKHLTFADEVFGPEPLPFTEAIRELKLEPYIVTESAGTQADDAITLKKLYFGK